jgi:hypothetical protein
MSKYDILCMGMMVIASEFFDDLDDVLVVELMLFAHFLWVELDRGTPNHGVAEVFDHVTMDFQAEVLDGGSATLDDDWSIVVWVFTLRLSVDTD